MDDYDIRYQVNQLDASFKGRFVMAFFVAGIPGKEHKFVIKTNQSLSVHLVATYVQISDEMQHVLNVLPKWTIPSPFMQTVHNVDIKHE